jgi:purine nucleosidase
MTGRQKQRIPVIFDCDNTMGVANAELDDGLALLFLLGRPDIQLLGVTTTFGNSSLDTVHDNTRRMFAELQLDPIPLVRGADSPARRASEASDFIIETVKATTTPVTLLATGSPTNVWAAVSQAPGIAAHIERVVFMGGVVEPLFLHGHPCDELNFSSDPEAARGLLRGDIPATVITGNLCLDAFMDAEMIERITGSHHPVHRYIADAVRQWNAFLTEVFGKPGFHLWDVAAAAWITNPELYDENRVDMVSSPADMGKGFLKTRKNSRSRINIPRRLLDPEAFWPIVFDAWEAVPIPPGQSSPLP